MLYNLFFKKKSSCYINDVVLSLFQYCWNTVSESSFHYNFLHENFNLAFSLTAINNGPPELRHVKVITKIAYKHLYKLQMKYY